MLSLSGVRKWTKVHLAIYIALDIEVLHLFTTIKAQNLKKKKKNWTITLLQTKEFSSLTINLQVVSLFIKYLIFVLFQVQEPGLQSSYHHDRGTYQLLRKFMALPFLPAGAILEAFFKLKRKANTDQLKASANYLEQNWIVINTWPLSCWSVYLRAIRTNNDVERWHNGLNRRAQVG